MCVTLFAAGVDLTRYSDECDILVVGGGAAGMAAAIRAKQLQKQIGTELRVCLLEKAAEPGKGGMCTCFLQL